MQPPSHQVHHVAFPSHCPSAPQTLVTPPELLAPREQYQERQSYKGAEQNTEGTARLQAAGLGARRLRPLFLEQKQDVHVDAEPVQEAEPLQRVSLLAWRRGNLGTSPRAA
eukprot:scaffold3076_cov248-Pinguiococcus_pyrenoidosus.AAC.8